MPAINFFKLAVSLTIKLPANALAQHLAASPYVVGEQLAEVVSTYVRKHKLGYYPALDFFRQQNELDPDLLNALENIAWVAANMAREELRIRLRPVFSNITFESIQNHVYTMPTMRPGQPNAINLLTRHLTPDTVKVNLITTLVQKLEDEKNAITFARHLVQRWLENRFEALEINSVEIY